MTWPLAFVIATALAALCICGLTSTCHEVMPQLATVVGTIVGGAYGLATADARARRKRHPTGPHRTVGENDR